MLKNENNEYDKKGNDYEETEVMLIICEFIYIAFSSFLVRNISALSYECLRNSLAMVLNVCVNASLVKV